MMSTRNWIDRITLLLVIVGGLNWLTIGLFKMDFVKSIFGDMTMTSRTIFTLVGISALYCISLLFRESANND